MNKPQPLIINLMFWLSAAMLCFAPLIRAGRTSPALMTLEIIGLLLLILAFWTPVEKKRIPLLAWLLIAAGVLVPLLYLVPLPLSVWQSLPGRELYAETQALIAGMGGSVDYFSLSLVPYRTLSSLLALLPILGIFITTLLLPRKNLFTLVYVFLGIATFQAALGLIQYGSGASWAFWFGINHGDKNALGTYPNYDHFAGLMELTIPLTLALTAHSFHISINTHENETHRNIFNQTLLFFLLSILYILGSIFSGSRMGIALAMLGILLSSLLFAKHLGGNRTLGFTTVLTTISLGVALNIGLIPILNRFGKDPAEDVRWEMFSQTWVGIQQFFPFGSGLGTFQPVFLAFQPPELQNFVNHTHNDYLELLFETGIMGLGIMLLFIALYLHGWLKLRQTHRWNRFHFLQTASGISLLLMVLHGLADFNFHTPANAIFFAFLGGIFLHNDNKKSPR